MLPDSHQYQVFSKAIWKIVTISNHEILCDNKIWEQIEWYNKFDAVVLRNIKKNPTAGFPINIFLKKIETYLSFIE